MLKKIEEQVSTLTGQYVYANELTSAQMLHEDMFPELKDYCACWPVHSILKLALKYGSEAARRKRQGAGARRMRAALRGETPDAMEE